MNLKQKEQYSNCTLCPRQCGVNRNMGEKGICKANSTLMLARAALHMWEEPCISGENGSGTVFFSGCQLGCVFCQNKPVAQCVAAMPVSDERLVDIFLELQSKGANNINLVTGDHFVPHIICALDAAKEKGLKIPVVYNCSGYESINTLKMLEGYVDIYLPDFKYMSPKLSNKYSSAHNYADIAKAAIAEMYRQTGENEFSHNGLMKSGVIVRHLLLPCCVGDSKRIIKYLYNTYGSNIYISIMSQYTPTENFRQYTELNRKITNEEYNTLVDYAVSLGITKAYTQSGEAASESFIPMFDYYGVK